MTEEIWKDILIDNKKSDYQVSNFGNVKRLGKFKHVHPIDKRPHKIWLAPRTLRPINCHGYPTVILYKKHYRVHRLVALYFLKNINNYPIVNHLDGNTRNNNYKNLEWCTQARNSQHAFNIGLKNAPKGERNGQTKINEETVLIIRDMLLNGEKPKDIYKKLNITYGIVRNIAKGFNWSWLTGIKQEFRSRRRILDEHEEPKNLIDNTRKIVENK